MPTYHRPFKAVPTEYDGVRYASKTEAARAATLDLLKKAGAVDWWIGQVTIRLGPVHKYRVDFLVSEAGRVHAEDVKGIRTRQQAEHEKHWRHYGPFPLHVLAKKDLAIIEGGNA